MSLFDRILRDAKYLENIALSMPYNEKDIRRTFFLKIVSCINDFYYGYGMLEMCRLAKAGELCLPNTFTKEELYHPNTFLSILRDPNYSGYKNGLNRHLIIDSWTAFEFCITEILFHIINDDKLQNLYLYQFHDVIKILNSIPNTVINEKISEKLKKRFKLKHIPINRKINELFKLYKGIYLRDKKADKKFLDYFGKLRNSMHNNFIYKGNNYEYVFNGIKTVFKNNRFIWFSCTQDDIPYFLLRLEKRLVVIFSSIIQGIIYKKIILDPITTNNKNNTQAP
jgi:hypothetical protein